MKPIASGMCVNGYPYKEIDGKWVPDEDARREQFKQEAQEQKEKDDLMFACRTRVLTLGEMAKVESYGDSLFFRMQGGMSQSYNQEEIDCRFNELMLQQFRLRRVAEQS